MDAGYGFGLPGNRGVLRPYTGMTLGDAVHRAMRTHIRWLAPDAIVGLKATRQTSDAGKADNEVGSKVRFASERGRRHAPRHAPASAAVRRVR